MKIISFNAREWSRDMNPFSPHFWMKRMSKMRKMLLQERPDVICFQEMRWPATWYIPKEYKRVTKQKTPHPVYTMKDSSYILAHETLSVNSFGSWVRILRPYGFGWANLYNVHLSCNDEIRAIQLGILGYCSKPESSSSKNCLICGDFNATPENVMPYFPHLKLLSSDICTYESFETGAGACIDHFIGNIEDRYVYIDEDSLGNRMSDHYPMMIEI